jgi:glutathione synthase/RimK-type ligase-like ATP-grasp enzyme
MLIGYAGKTRPTALQIAVQSSDISAKRTKNCDINWGRSDALSAKLNPDISKTTNKRIMRTLFWENEVPMPRLFTPSEAYTQALRGNKMVGRPDKHTKGRGFWLVDSEQKFTKALRGTRKKKAATHFMEYIEAPREYRVHIFNGKSIRISEKSFGESGQTAQGLYITRKPQHEVKHVRKAAKQAVKAVGLDFGAVDILANDTDCWVTEVNSAPGLGGSLPSLYAEKFKQWKESLLLEN